MRRGLLLVLAIAAVAAIWWFGLRDRTKPGAEVVPIPASSSEAGEGAEVDAAHAADPVVRGGPELEAKGSRRPTAGEASEAALTGDGVTVIGQVLDGRRRPVAGAEVTIHASYTDGRRPLTGTTDARGHYRIPGLVRPAAWATVMAWARHGRFAGQAGAAVHEAMSAELEIRRLVLGPSHSLEIRVQHEDGRAAGGARILLASSALWETAVLADLYADATGVVRIEGLADGSYRAHAALDGYGRGTTQVGLPQREPGPVIVTVGPERQLVAIVVDKETGQAIQGARILVDEMVKVPMMRILPWAPRQPDLVTDQQGRATIRGLGLEDPVQIDAEFEGYSGRGHMRMHTSIAQGDTEVRIELQKSRQMRWPLAAENPHAPAEGTALGLAQPRGAVTAPLPRSARIEDGQIVAEGCHAGLFHVVVVAPGGAFAQVMALPAGGKVHEATFQLPRKVRVILKRADGSPAEGYYISVRNPGNNVLVDPIQLGSDGQIELAVRSQHLINVFAARSSGPYAGIAIGSLNLKEDGGTVESALAAGREVELRIVIDGEARLPGRYTLGFMGSGAADIEEDPATGTLRFEVSSPATGPTKFSFNATGYLPHALELPVADGDAAAQLDVVLSRGGSVLLRIQPPADGSHNVQVNKSGVETRGFRIPQPGDRATQLGIEDGWIVRRHGPFAPGEYEASDYLSKARSGTFTIAAGRETVVELDLSHVGNLEGRVVVPEGHDFAGARIFLVQGDEKPDPKLWYSGTSVRRDGTFTIRVPGSRMVTLAVTHPRLTAASPGGRADVKEPGDEVVLELVAGGTASFQLEPAPAPAPVRGRGRGRGRGRSDVNVYLYEKAPAAIPSNPTHSLNARRDGDTYSIAGFQPGTYTVVLDMQGRAPALLGRRELGAKTDLGTVSTTEGTTIRFRLQVREGQDPPRIFAFATAKGGITYRRSVNSRGEAEVLLQGLGPGTFEVRAQSMQGGAGGAKGVVKQTIESDGETEIVIEMDLR